MIDQMPPFLVYLLAAGLIPLVPAGPLRSALLCLVPIAGLALAWQLPMGSMGGVTLFGFDLVLLRVDRLSLAFATMFSLAGGLAMLYAWHLRDTLQQVAALLYAGSAMGAVFAGDLLSLFIFWEGTAIASVLLIWARRTEGAFHTGMRYLLMQITSGVLLVAGTAIQYQQTGSLTFGPMTLGSLASWLILVAFGIKCAFPLVHGWLQDAYPAATVTGTVFLSIFTTKLAVYALARGFAGTELLIWVGAVMALMLTLHALLENDLRRVLAQALNIQLGFMVVGVGIGTELALNGTVAHAFASVFYKGLLFMAVGAVLFRTGTARASDLGGLFRSMPWTMLACILGGLSISAVPLFSGFTTKSLILSAAGKGQYDWVWGILLFASAAAVLHTGLRITCAIFLGQDSGLRPKEAPGHMLAAMAAMAVICSVIGVRPEMLYALLPHDVAYDAYTLSHVITQLQLVAGAALAYGLLARADLLPRNLAAGYLGLTWIGRRVLPRALGGLVAGSAVIWAGVAGFVLERLGAMVRAMHRTHGPEGRMARVWPTGAMVIWVAVLLLAVMLVNFI